jgi:ferredoxin/flavodoxin---NADP+ reductase
MSNLNQESVLSVHHWTNNLFSFTTTRNPSFRFRSGEFIMIGLKVGERPLLRAYSVASAHYEDTLEFFSIKVPDGPLTSRLQHLKEGDEIIVSRKATGTLVVDNLDDGRNLYLIGTGTGLAPFLSVIRDPEVYDRFEKVVLLHGCRRVAELAYGEMIQEKLPNDELLGDLVRNQLIYYPTVTRDPFRNRGRITDLINSGKLFADIGLAPLEAAHDRVMICGSPALVRDSRELLGAKGFVEGNHGEPGQFVVEKAFAERLLNRDAPASISSAIVPVARWSTLSRDLSWPSAAASARGARYYGLPRPASRVAQLWSSSVRGVGVAIRT